MTPSPFIDHPASVGETYTEHLAAATSFALRMLLGGVACLIHGVLPFLFVKTGSTLIAGLHDRMVVNRRRHGGAGSGDRLAGSPAPGS